MQKSSSVHSKVDVSRLVEKRDSLEICHLFSPTTLEGAFPSFSVIYSFDYPSNNIHLSLLLPEIKINDILLISQRSVSAINHFGAVLLKPVIMTTPYS
jgi:hypothetical protein